jgi:PAB1-binding protein PBP1
MSSTENPLSLETETGYENMPIIKNIDIEVTAHSSSEFKQDKHITQTKHFTSSLEMLKKNLEQNAFKSTTKDKITRSLEEENLENWDQFEENRKLFKTESNYSENYYNTEIREETIPETLKIEAEKIEKELKASKSKNGHLNEERGLLNDDDYESKDDEEKYSSVMRDGNLSVSSGGKKMKKGGRKEVKDSSKETKRQISKKTIFSNTGKGCLLIIVLFLVFIIYRVYKINQVISTKKMKM